MRATAAVIVALAFATVGVAVGAPATTQTDPVDVVPDIAARIGERLVPHRNSWRVVVESPDGTRRDDGVWTDTFDLIEHRGHALLRFDQEYIDATGALVRDNVSLFHYPSLTPVHVELNLPTGRLLTDYFGRQVAGSFLPHGESEPRTFGETLEAPAFEFGIGANLLLHLRWSEGTSLRAPFAAVTIDGSSGLRWMEIRIGEPATVRFEGQEVTTHVVEIEEMGWRMWMVPEPPYVYRSSVPRANGDVTWFELLRFES